MNCHKTIPMILALGMIIISTLACSFGGTTTEKPTTPPESKKTEVSSPADDPGKLETNTVPTFKSPELTSKFPLPPKAKVIQTSDETVTATVSMSIKDIIEFYRTDAKKKGLTEYDLLTVISDKTFSMAFRVPGQEEELVLQGTDIGNNSVAFSLRYEETDVK